MSEVYYIHGHLFVNGKYYDHFRISTNCQKIEVGKVVDIVSKQWKILKRDMYKQYMYEGKLYQLDRVYADEVLNNAR